MRQLILALIAGVLIGMVLSPIILKAVQYPAVMLTDNSGVYVGSAANPLYVSAVPSPTPTP